MEKLRVFFSKHRVLVIIFAIALAVRLLLFFINLNVAGGDFIATISGGDGYYEISKNLIEGRGYTFDEGPDYKAEFLRPPVWIFIMAILAKLFNSYVPVLIVELFMGSFIPVVGVLLAQRIVLPRLAVAVGILLALEPFSVLLSFITLTETSFTFFLLLSLLFVFRYIERRSTRNIVWTAVFLALAILIKPTVQFFPILVPIGLYWIFRKHYSLIFFKHALYFVITIALILTPWLYRNQQEFGKVSLSSQAAFNVYSVLVPSVLSIENGTDFKTEYAALNKVLKERGDEITPANSSQYMKEALSMLSQHKVAFLKSIGISMLTFFTHDGMLTVLSYSKVIIPNMFNKPVLTMMLSEPLRLFQLAVAYSKTPAVLVLFGRLGWVIVFMLFLFGTVRYFRREQTSSYAYAALGVVLYFALLTTANGLGMNARFRMPVNAFIFTFAVYGFYFLYRSIMAKLPTKHEKSFDHHTRI